MTLIKQIFWVDISRAQADNSNKKLLYKWDNKIYCIFTLGIPTYFNLLTAASGPLCNIWKSISNFKLSWKSILPFEWDNIDHFVHQEISFVVEQKEDLSSCIIALMKLLPFETITKFYQKYFNIINSYFNIYLHYHLKGVEKLRFLAALSVLRNLVWVVKEQRRNFNKDPL